jgi:alpha-beta hydrolase superfamily lysophospholipase
MKHIEGTFAGSGGVELVYQAWRPEGNPRGVLAIVHGLGDHSGRFDNLVTPLVEHGFAATAFDLRGFGRSPGRKGHIHRWEEYREDVRAFLRLIGPGAPVFLFGYSFGSMIVLDFIVRSPEGLSGAVLSATAIEPVGVGTPAQKRLARAFSRVWPTFTIRRAEDFSTVSRDPAVLAALQADPLHHNLVTARWGAESMAMTDWLPAQAEKVRLPVLFVHGGDDPINMVRGVQRFYDQMTYPDKTLKIYPGSRHETHNDLDHAQVAADIIEWMEKRTAIPSGG